MFFFPGVRQGSRAAGIVAAVAFAVFIALTVWGVSFAKAADVWVSPDGDSTWPCVETDPCSFEGAFDTGMVSAGDAILLTAGVHSLTPGESLFITTQVDIGPAPGAGRPVISQPSVATATSAIALLAGNSRIHDIAIATYGSGGAIHMVSGTAERISVEVNGSYGYGITAVGTSAIANSVIRLAGPNSSGVFTGSSSVRILSSTIYGAATGTVGVASNTCYGSHYVDVWNSLVVGEWLSFRLVDQCEVGTHSIVFSTYNTAFDTSKVHVEGDLAVFDDVRTLDTGEVDPGLRNGFLGDFRLTAGSPLIDAGSTDDWGYGTIDNLGLVRVQGAGLDIGALEFPVPPKVKLKGKRVSNGKKIKLQIRCDVACPQVKVKGGVKPKTVRNAKAGKWKKVTLKVKKPNANKVKVKVTAFDVDNDSAKKSLKVKR